MTDGHQRDAAPSTMGEAVTRALSRAAHLLPDQAPIRVFIHHNTLHAFQHLPFHAAVRKGHEVYGAEPYAKEERFRAYLSAGRITQEDLSTILSERYTRNRCFLDGRLDEARVRMSIMSHAIGTESSATLNFLILEQDATRRLRKDLSQEARQRIVDESLKPLLGVLANSRREGLTQFARLVTGVHASTEAIAALGEFVGFEPRPAPLQAALEADPEAFAASALWAACLDFASDYLPATLPQRSPPRLPRDQILSETGVDIYDQVFPALIRLSSAYLDEGVAYWPLPEREQGFYHAARHLIAHGSRSPIAWLSTVKATFAQQEARNMSAEAVVCESLESLGVSAAEAPDFVERLLLSLPGWAGLMSRLERHRDDRPHGGPPASLMDFLAVRLTYELAACRDALANTGKRHRPFPLHNRRGTQGQERRPASPETLAFKLFQLMQLNAISFATLRALPRHGAHEILGILEDLDDFTRRELFQEAFELHHRREVLDSLAAQRSHTRLDREVDRPRFQLVTCFDEREESLRRQLEEVAHDVETFGAPGFFGAAIRFRALDEAHHVPLAPVLVVPTHHIDERPTEHQEGMHRARSDRRKAWARFAHQMHTGSRSLWRGTVLNLAFGVLALFPLLTRIVSPRVAGELKRWTAKLVLPSPRTELTIHHDVTSDPGHVRGFKVDERVARVGTVLENIGLVDNFSRLVVILGHGSTTLNNPHKSAYDCGACGGRQGGPNARVVAHMANDPRVRAGLRARGIIIPEDTFFVGGQHDTCNDAITLFDTDAIPTSHGALFAETLAQLDEARARNAQERCRRLFSAPRDGSPAQSLRHVEARSEHLAEPRPEFGHATNAVAIIGRRAISRGLFLDRRAFLLSYDPTIDADGTILERTLAAALPVGAGINLEYYFSHVDNERYGAGSKLPHNVTGLVGVMTGHASDLRTGLPRQMIEIHEPLRLLVIVEATPARLLEIASRQAEVGELVVNRWIQLVSLDPESGAMHVFTDHGFVPYTPHAVELPVRPSSRAFYHGHEDCLPPARIVRTSDEAA